MLIIWHSSCFPRIRNENLYKQFETEIKVDSNFKKAIESRNKIIKKIRNNI